MNDGRVTGMGWCDEICIESGRLTVTGWGVDATASSEAIHQFEIAVLDEVICRVEATIDRPDVVHELGGSTPLRCGFTADIDVSTYGLKSPSDVTIHCRGAAGKSFQIFGAGAGIAPFGEAEKVQRSHAVICLERLIDKYDGRGESLNWEYMLRLGYETFLDSESVAIDVGGHCGLHSEILINDIKVRNLIIVEPVPKLAQGLRSMFADTPQVKVLENALSSEGGTSCFIINHNVLSESGLCERVYGKKTTADQLEEITVKVVRLDDITADLDRLDYIKIDAEGAEIDIVKGGRETLSNLRPICSVEFGAGGYAAYGYTQDDLYNEATNLEYTIFDIFGNAMNSLEVWRTCVDSFYWDFYLVPNEKIKSFTADIHGRVTEELSAFTMEC